MKYTDPVLGLEQKSGVLERIKINSVHGVDKVNDSCV